MKRLTRCPEALLLIVTLAACSHGGSSADAGAQRNFGVRMAKMNLWREAMFRFQRAVQLDPANAMAHNNLAVAFEANGDFDNAAREYREALRLDRSNQYIQKNYSRFVEFLSRNKKRQQRQEQKSAAVDAPVPASTPSSAAPREQKPPPTPPPPQPPEGGSR